MTGLFTLAADSWRKKVLRSQIKKRREQDKINRALLDDFLKESKDKEQMRLL
jgi:hypothetical protein